MSKTALDPEIIESIRDLQSPEEPQFLKDYLTEFLDSVPGRLSKIKEAIHGMNSEVLEHEAHSLKSSCANSGANKMAFLCGELELVGKTSRLEGALLVFEKLSAEFVQLQAEVQLLPEFRKAG